VGGFVGGPALQAGPEGLEWVVAAVGLLAYITSISFALKAFTPRPGWPTGQDTRKLVEAASAETLASVVGHLAVSYQDAFESCQVRADKLAGYVRISVIFMAVELGFLVCLLGLTATK
jgi:hypothetical protein